MGKKAIAVMLNEMGAPKRFGHELWRSNTVAYILSNERYIGDALFQKSCREESVPFKKHLNRGEKAKYYVENTNLPIISVDEFNATQRLLQRKSPIEKKNCTRYALTKKIACPCGCFYSRVVVRRKIYWECKQHEVVKSAKPSTRRVPEKDVNNAFITMVNKMQQCRALILPVAISQTERLQMKAGGTTERIRAIDRQIAEFNNKNLVLARLNTKGILRPTE